jgi:hypothetical protein
MRQIQVGMMILMFVFIEGCSNTSKISAAHKTREDLRDVFVLTRQVLDLFRNSSGQDFDIENLFDGDSLSRISNNFEEIKQTFRGGHIAIQYRFSKKEIPKLNFQIMKAKRKKIGE